ncbi:hypothetical protein PLICRDRAFT_366539 [Plicaturopsis crispa FD-325 SS-3]|uniref:F-box domain-containing protein n=1 Tax=Plicaturopsis crispa FD-325 SS-3 TaxID=944288 RepID=A0A0C9SKN3_PLICR|nr:hypothetical protein PLICRDRAFT_366539 [Plicaturopsis crispa FD-325 SS-3]
MSDRADRKDAPVLVHDTLVQVLEYLRLQQDYHSLYQCSLASREFNKVASKALYTRVVLSPPFERVLDLKNRNKIKGSGLFDSACLPHNAGYVSILEIGGYLPTRPPSANPLGGALHNAIQSFFNVQHVAFVPLASHPDLFTDSLRALKNCQYLRSLDLNAASLGESGSTIVAEIGKLEKLTLRDPSRATLNILPEWLHKLSMSLTELHLRDNCGSITPGVLRSFLPYIRNITAFTLGLSYSLSDDDVFDFLDQLPELRSVSLHYYLQNKPRTVEPALPNLRALTVTYSPWDMQDGPLSQWVQHATSSSPSLECLRLVLDQRLGTGDILLNAGDSITEYVAAKYAGTLRVLEHKSAHVRTYTFDAFAARCHNIEVLALRSLGNDIESPESDAPSSRIEQATFIFKRLPSLRRLRLLGTTWERFWTSDTPASGANLVVREVVPRTPPWERSV